MKSVYTLIVASLLTIVVGLWWLSSQPLPTKTDPAPGSHEWCEAMLEVPGAEWTDPDTLTFAEHCLLD